MRKLESSGALKTCIERRTAVKLTGYGHACFMIDVGDFHLLADPFITGNPTAPVKAEDVKRIGEEGIDLAGLPIGDNFTMGPEDALRAVKLINPAKVIPIHYNTFDVIRQDPEAWAKRIEKETAAKVAVMTPADQMGIKTPQFSLK